MIEIYPYIEKMAEALRDNADFTEYCVDTFGRAQLVQIDDNPANPIPASECPWLTLFRVPNALFGPTANSESGTVAISVGVIPAEPGDLPLTINRERTNTVSGYNIWGSAKMAEALLVRAVNVVKTCDFAEHVYIKDGETDLDGSSYLPMTIAAATINIGNYRTLSDK